MIRLSVVCLVLVSVGTVTRSPVVADESIDEYPITDLDRDHWAYDPIRRPELPQVDQVEWVQTEIDRFILARLEESGLKPAERADRPTLLRRLCWDLTGLPPSPEQIDQFVNDFRPDAYARMVDSLLASPDYGRRFAQPWLDLARFAETDGFEHDKIRESAWKYRDWVVDAMNSDLSYRDFIRQQIAGDQLDDADERSTLATAFCLSGPDMPDINLTEERRHVLLNEMTSTIGSVVLALQFGCAQCHDHKFDAISQADFYRLRAFFEPAIKLTKNRSVTVLTSNQDAPQTHLMIRGDYRRPGPELRPEFPRLLNPKNKAAGSSRSPRLALADWLTDPSNPLTARVAVNRIWQHHFGKGLSTTPSDFGVMSDQPTHPELMDYLADEFMRSGWSMKRMHRLIVLSGVYQTSGARPARHDVRQADWENALAQDPENQLLSHFPRRRLEAELIRDGLLAVSDSLNRAMGGPGVRPPLPEELVKTLKTGQWKVTEKVDEHFRSSIYLFARRNLRYPFFATFDRPTADQPCAMREQSTTAVQSLMLLNSDLMIQSAERLATRLGTLHHSRSEQINELYLRLYGRSPDPDETRAVEQFLASGADLSDVCRAMLNSNAFLYVD